MMRPLVSRDTTNRPLVMQALSGSARAKDPANIARIINPAKTFQIVRNRGAKYQSGKSPRGPAAAPMLAPASPARETSRFLRRKIRGVTIPPIAPQTICHSTTPQKIAACSIILQTPHHRSYIFPDIPRELRWNPDHSFDTAPSSLPVRGTDATTCHLCCFFQAGCSGCRGR